MEKKKEYSKPNMFLESFQPQEYCSGCEYFIVPTDPENYVAIQSNYKFWVDSGQDHIINGTDFNKHNECQTDGNEGWGDKDTYVWAWWAAYNTTADSIYNATNQMEVFMEKQAQGRAGYVEAVLNPSNHHYHAGHVTEVRNHS